MTRSIDSIPSPTQSLSTLVRSTDRVTVAAAIKFDGMHLFSSPVKFTRLRSPSIPFHCLGGQCLSRESWTDALLRELREETNEEGRLLSARRTRFVTSDGDGDDIAVSDRPRPLCVYHRTSAADVNFHHNYIRWLIGYRGAIQAQTLKPCRELAFILLLSDRALHRAARGDLTYADVARCKDGSRIVIRRGFSLDLSRLAQPEGLARLLATRWKVAVVQRWF